MTHPCHGCTYWVPLSESRGKQASDNERCCYYIGIVGAQKTV